jgi:hypothetical protein
MIPIFRPPRSITIEGLIISFNLGSSVAFKLTATTGYFNPERKGTKPSTP